jgi:MerR family transcriptional regulator, thiopeptide resistance regulator
LTLTLHEALASRMRRIGEVAAATGLTVRTLHHYDEIGLLAPAGRTEAGYRLYSGDDVRRLYRIVAFRRLGLALTEIGALLDRDGAATDLFPEAIEGMTMFERYYTPEQHQALEERRAALGEDGLRRAEADWAAPIAEAEALRAEGVPPSDPRVQALAARWSALIEQFTEGDAGILASLKTMYEREGVERASRGAVSPELLRWITQAMGA